MIPPIFHTYRVELFVIHVPFAILLMLQWVPPFPFTWFYMYQVELLMFCDLSEWETVLQVLRKRYNGVPWPRGPNQTENWAYWACEQTPTPLKIKYPLVICYIAIEHGDYDVDLPIDSMVDLSIVVCQRLPGRVHLDTPWYSQDTGPNSRIDPIQNYQANGSYSGIYQLQKSGFPGEYGIQNHQFLWDHFASNTLVCWY